MECDMSSASGACKPITMDWVGLGVCLNPLLPLSLVPRGVAHLFELERAVLLPFGIAVVQPVPERLGRARRVCGELAHGRRRLRAERTRHMHSCGLRAERMLQRRRRRLRLLRLLLAKPWRVLRPRLPVRPQTHPCAQVIATCRNLAGEACMRIQWSDIQRCKSCESDC
jgi:hypothetical protein